MIQCGERVILEEEMSQAYPVVISIKVEIQSRNLVKSECQDRVGGGKGISRSPNPYGDTLNICDVDIAAK